MIIIYEDNYYRIGANGSAGDLIENESIANYHRRRLGKCLGRVGGGACPESRPHSAGKSSSAGGNPPANQRPLFHLALDLIDRWLLLSDDFTRVPNSYLFGTFGVFKPSSYGCLGQWDIISETDAFVWSHQWSIDVASDAPVAAAVARVTAARWPVQTELVFSLIWWLHWYFDEMLLLFC